MDVTEILPSDSPLHPLVAERQLSMTDAVVLHRQRHGGNGHGTPTPANETEVLQWLAREYEVPFDALDTLEADRQVLSLFPARILLKEELLPLRRSGSQIQIATCRLFSTRGLDTLRTLSGTRPPARAGPSRSDPAGDEEEPWRRCRHHRHARRGQEPAHPRRDGGGQPARVGPGGRSLHHPLRQPGAQGRHRSPGVRHPSRALRG
ncbi:MAG: hypothetical protein FJ379_12310 [Verrucomicrobia bacterium]|nr:hypothetical protein [Verrucomicrobiota bacterium]